MSEIADFYDPTIDRLIKSIDRLETENAKLRATQADAEQPSVDWLDGRESCLIDGVRYTRAPEVHADLSWEDPASVPKEHGFYTCRECGELHRFGQARPCTEEPEGVVPEGATDNPLPCILPENFFSRVWHTDCEKSPSGVMKRLVDTLEIEDGSILRLWECLHCGVKVYAGLDARRFVVRRLVPIDQHPEGGEA